MATYFIRGILFSLLTFPLYSTTSMAEIGLKEINQSVVYISVTSRAPDYNIPWQYLGQEAMSGSGVIISNNRILTNAHVVENNISLEVNRANSPDIYKAEVQFICHECDLAILKVKDLKFYKGSKALPLGGLPNLQSSVSVYGFPEGGSQISVTKGIVSRIELGTYAYSGESLLSVQIDAAINSGNSGGPVIMDEKLIGIAMGILESAESIGYIIPMPVVKHFLKDIKDGKYDGFPDLGFTSQEISNRTLASFYGMKENQRGILINSVIYDSSSYGVLREDDVLVQIDGVDIGNDGKFQFNEFLRLNAGILVQNHQIDETVKVGIVRDKKYKEVEIKLKTTKGLVHVEYEKKPRYYIYGGILFVPLTSNYLDTWGEDAPSELLNLYSAYPTKERQEVVMTDQIFPHSINAGYQDLQYSIVKKVDGKSFKNFDSFVEILRKDNGQYKIIELEIATDNRKLILDNKAAVSADKEILNIYKIPHYSSFK